MNTCASKQQKQQQRGGQGGRQRHRQSAAWRGGRRSGWDGGLAGRLRRWGGRGSRFKPRPCCGRGGGDGLGSGGGGTAPHAGVVVGEADAIVALAAGRLLRQPAISRRAAGAVLRGHARIAAHVRRCQVVAHPADLDVGQRRPSTRVLMGAASGGWGDGYAARGRARACFTPAALGARAPGVGRWDQRAGSPPPLRGATV